MKAKRNTRVLILLTVLAAVATLAWPGLAHERVAQKEVGKIVTTGQAELTVAPNVATVVVGVSTLEDTAAQAQAAAAKHMAALFAALEKLGVPERFIQTRSFNVGPEYQYYDGKRILVGYRARHDLHIKLDNLEHMGAVLDAVVAAGASEVHNVQFGLQDDSAVLQRALELAVRDARLKAEALAKGAGVRVSRIARISDRSSNNVVIPMERSGFATLAAVADKGTQLAGGEITVRANVEVEFEFE